MHRTGRRGLGRSYIDGIRTALGDRCRRHLSDGRRPVARSGAPAGARSPPPPTPTSSSARGTSPAGAIVNWPLRRRVLSRFANPYIRLVTRLSAARLHDRLSLLAARGARRPPARSDFVSDGYSFLVEMLYMASQRRLPHRRGADHLRRAAGGRIEAVAGGAVRIGDHAVAADRELADAARASAAPR